MSRVIINRKREYANRLRVYYIYVDGNKVGVVPYNRSVAFDVEPGSHRMKLKIDWAGSPEVLFDIADGETKSFEASSFKYGSWLLPIGALLCSIAFILQLTMQIYWVFWIALPFILLLLYYITLGRHKYLQLTPK